jgi:starch synthase
MALRVLAVASECAPLIKTGGLADVVGALPAALATQDVRVTTLLPGYPAVMAALGQTRALRRLDDLFGGPARLQRGEAAGLDLLVLDAPHLFARGGNPYLGPHGAEWDDNGIRFAALAAAASLVATGGLRGLCFDVVHAHDWQAGLVPAYLRFAATGRKPVMFTVHNLAFQGKFPLSLFPRLGLPPEALSVQGVEYYGTVGYLKAGLWYSDRISTVSPNYAAEIRTPELGMGLDGLLRGRGSALSGILNGIGDEWDPRTDTHLAAQFSADDLAPRAENKRALQARLGLDENPDAPLFGFVGRLAWQKGVDLVLGALPGLLGEGAQLAILGTGEWSLEEGSRGAAYGNLGRVGTVIGFDEGLARLIYAVRPRSWLPSRLEPCGLASSARLRYGACRRRACRRPGRQRGETPYEMAVAAGVRQGLPLLAVPREMLEAPVLRALTATATAAGEAAGECAAHDVSWTRSAAATRALRDMARHAG